MVRAVGAAAGLPVGVQLAGRPWRDEAVLAAMAEVEAAVAFDARPVALDGLAVGGGGLASPRGEVGGTARGGAGGGGWETAPLGERGLDGAAAELSAADEDGLLPPLAAGTPPVSPVSPRSTAYGSCGGAADGGGGADGRGGGRKGPLAPPARQLPAAAVPTERTRLVRVCRGTDEDASVDEAAGEELLTWAATAWRRALRIPTAYRSGPDLEAA